MAEEKVGGYDISLTPRVALNRDRVRAHQTHLSSREAERSPDDARLAEHILSTLDISSLQNIFLEYLDKAGVPAQNANLEALEKIHIRPFQGLAGVYGTFLNHTAFSIVGSLFVEAKRFLAEGKQIPEDVVLELQLTLIHEMSHIFSRNRISSKDKNNSQSTVTEESGYSSGTYDIRQSMMPNKRGKKVRDISSTFEALNEGVTQRIAEEIFLEYGRKVGKYNTYKQHLAKGLQKQRKSFSNYYLFGNQVDSICVRVAEYTGGTKKDIWEKIKRGYFNSPNDILTQLEGVFGSGFIEEYKTIGGTSKQQKLAAFDRKNDFSHPTNYAETWLADLGIEQES
mgnify:CR=1 FL=1